MKKVKKLFKKSKGFTLIEMLVVVLIIGILAGIALPQYQMAVGKARFSTLKALTKSIQQSAQRYYIINNAYPDTSTGLDINLDIKSETSPNSGVEITLKDGITCKIWRDNSTDEGYIACNRKIFGKKVWYYIGRETGRPLLCFVVSSKPSDLASHLCAKETNKPIKSSCPSDVCSYSY